ncbi:hypothetical protein [Candidatus Mycoplasma haematohominis]|uniref:Uncharacterized protein n=1 Tax=Candidatus Mycoplasma haematohominis TaxID=1494318 RepID=A0A478FQE1_9MOLU|nr:hypothetical protein [Candidatus Mycoplasma haemohominis]GCE63701.1 hypothetical protein MHSWG343_07010 [Candidatus Mycoplasma haemohominis]
MPTQAVAGAAAGAALLGGGGTLAAYAAGAFNTKWEDTTFEEYAQSLGKLKYLGESSTTLNTPPTKTNIEAKIGNATSGGGYRDVLKGNWDHMKKEDVAEEEKNKRPQDSKDVLFPASAQSLDKKSEIAQWTEAWCGAIGKKRVKAKIKVGDDTKWNKEFFNRDDSWKAFKEVCLTATP